ncbi:wax ester synthase/diacylglycerol acyltransferase 5-like [Corylus avellana]|uniref:wax ester synthase/diacylglycerol acyltransferase 5-like n=1 Tax=Corylus avellana TaxID=13451 RepID=UPI00286CF859|nr:wax ester synthase/diacylglycerol acyltransferase 5-like [Corylus avellana]
MELKEGLEPVSPTAQYFNSSALSAFILTVLEIEVPIITDIHVHAISLLKDLFLPINPRFSSVMVTNQKGDRQWKRVEVKLEDHVNVPIFPAGLSPTSYDAYLDDYLSKVAMDHFPQSKPLWEVHVFKYPTSNAAGNIIFKLHHSLGDGYSLMGALRSADHPSAPLKLPSRPHTELESDNKSALAKVFQIFPLISNSLSDFGWSILKSTLVKDDRTPIRLGDEGVVFLPITISTMTFSLDRIKHIKAKLGLTNLSSLKMGHSHSDGRGSSPSNSSGKEKASNTLLAKPKPKDDLVDEASSRPGIGLRSHSNPKERSIYTTR